MARADGEKLRARAAEQAKIAQQELRQHAREVYPQAARLVREILFGQAEGR